MHHNEWGCSKRHLIKLVTAPWSKRTRKFRITTDQLNDVLRENGDRDLDRDLSNDFNMMKRPPLDIGISSYIADFIRKVQKIL